ncbi:arsenate reductase [Agaribacterium sp. ZY112]|uniref:arsenate reductase n=1 Tax=Agaribacterium sp. ZY112 TaxID=3233574 RepID=UPI00352603B6
MNTLYGIPNCDTVKKARNWLEQQGIEYRFHDLRKDGISQNDIQVWLEALGPSTLVNKRSTTWKQLSEQEKLAAMSDKAAHLLETHPTLIKRPVLSSTAGLHVGFKADTYNTIFS